MNIEDVIQHGKELVEIGYKVDSGEMAKSRAYATRVSDFLNRFGEKNNSFFVVVSDISKQHANPNYVKATTIEVLESFLALLESGISSGISPKRQAELDVVSDFLMQADMLLNTNKVHPVAPAILIGATLEEFLRTWVESENISLGTKKPSIDSYAKALKENEFISKQDIKDITAWAGIRNHAAHGEWGELGDINRVKLMLDGVNLFMRKYSS